MSKYNDTLDIHFNFLQQQQRNFFDHLAVKARVQQRALGMKITLVTFCITLAVFRMEC